MSNTQLLTGRASENALRELIQTRFKAAGEPTNRKGYHFDKESEAWTAWDDTNTILQVQDFDTRGQAREWLELI